MKKFNQKICLKLRAALSDRKRKVAFTLAEVLITLGIIGIVAALTLPSVITNIQDYQYKSALKKSYSVLSNAINRAYEYDYDDFSDAKQSLSYTTSIAEKLLPYLEVLKVCGHADGCWPVTTKAKNGKTAVLGNDYILSYAEHYGFILNDGTLVALSTWQADNALRYLGVEEEDLFENTFTIAVDVNGLKKPNVTGRDIFVFLFTKKGFVPAGIAKERSHCDDYSVNYNWDCAAKVLYEK